MDGRKLVIVGVSTVAAGAVAYGVYWYLQRRDGGPPVMTACSTSIERKHIAYIAAKAAELTEGDCDVIVRVLLDYAMHAGSEPAIFGVTRCNTCGGKKDKAANVSSIYSDQNLFLDLMASKYSLKDGKSKVMRIVCEYAMTDGDAAEMFTGARLAKCRAV